MFKVSSPTRLQIEDGNVIMDVLPKSSVRICDIFSDISGKLLRLEQPKRLSRSRDVKLR